MELPEKIVSRETSEIAQTLPEARRQMTDEEVEKLKKFAGLENLPEIGKIHGEPELRVPLRYLQNHAKEPYKSKRSILCWLYDPGEPFQVVSDGGFVTNYEDHVFLTFGELSTAIILPRANLEKHFDPAKKSHKLTNITEGEEDNGKDEATNPVRGDRELQDGDRNNLEDQVPKGDTTSND